MPNTTDDTETMLRAIINGLSAFKQEFLTFKKEVFQRFDDMDRKIDGVEERLTKRINTIGKQAAYLEDDTPTREEFNKLEKRVDELELKPSSNI
jgi:tetrahydromethanopterin S-methyltransferase subunit G